MFTAIRRLHLVIGLVGLVAFLATGLYMDRVHGHLRGYSDSQRLLFRSTHIYLLLAAVVNALLGLYLVPSGIAWRRGIQMLGSAALVVTPALFLAAFCTEPWLSGLARPWTKLGAYLTLGGVMLDVLAAAGRSRSVGQAFSLTSGYRGQRTSG
jgi:hypothetical protein